MKRTPINKLQLDKSNPRKATELRLELLRLSIAKLGFLQPLFALPNGFLLSGHQRIQQTRKLGFKHVPVESVSVPDKKVQSINILFNRATNDFTYTENGGSAESSINVQELLQDLSALPDLDITDWPVWSLKPSNLKNLSPFRDYDYDTNALTTAKSLQRMGIKIPLVLSTEGKVLNGIYRYITAKSEGVGSWPVVVAKEGTEALVNKVLNFLSMDYHLNDNLKDLLRSCAFRRPSNNRGYLPKGMRFWCDGEATKSQKDTYEGVEYWRRFKSLHGDYILDFGGGLCKSVPFLKTHGIDGVDFEPYMLDPTVKGGIPCLKYSREKAQNFLKSLDNKKKFTSIFLSSVMNSIPFPEDRLKVLCIVNALCDRNTVVYGTCRSFRDFAYSYKGMRQYSQFVLDHEDGIKVGDILANPKIQKYHTPKEARENFERFWSVVDFWPGGNVFFFRLKGPKKLNKKALKQSLEFEFDLPFKEGGRLGLVDEAKEAFQKRLTIKL